MSLDRLHSDGDQNIWLASGQIREPHPGDANDAGGPTRCSTLFKWRRTLARLYRGFVLDSPPNGWPIF